MRPGDELHLEVQVERSRLGVWKFGGKATVSTNVTVLYGAGMGLLGATGVRSPYRSLVAVAIIQLLLCFVPLIYGSFLAYFEMFLNVVGL